MSEAILMKSPLGIEDVNPPCQALPNWLLLESSWHWLPVLQVAGSFSVTKSLGASQYSMKVVGYGILVVGMAQFPGKPLAGQ
jgi:hypothetical protein